MHKMCVAAASKTVAGRPKKTARGIFRHISIPRLALCVYLSPILSNSHDLCMLVQKHTHCCTHPLICMHIRCVFVCWNTALFLMPVILIPATACTTLSTCAFVYYFNQFIFYGLSWSSVVVRLSLRSQQTHIYVCVYMHKVCVRASRKMIRTTRRPMYGEKCHVCICAVLLLEINASAIGYLIWFIKARLKTCNGDIWSWLLV